MSKKSKEVGVAVGGNVANISCGYGYVVSDHIVDRLNGQMFQLVESLGLPEKQEEAIKGLIRKSNWECFSEAIYITPERHTEIRNLYWEKKKQINGEFPMSAI